MNVRNIATRLGYWAAGIGLVGICLFGGIACVGTGPKMVGNGRGEVNARVERTVVPSRFREKTYSPVSAQIPKVAGAEMVKDDELCMTCHEAYVTHHKTNIHREQSCETCHGPGSEHVRTRGQTPGMILSFKKMAAAERSEACLQCHEKDACSPGTKWRTSAHAHGGVSCTDCHKGHYNVPPGTAATKVAALEQQQLDTLRVAFQQSKKEPVDTNAIRLKSNAMGARGVQTCYRCHQQTQDLERIAHPHQIHGKNNFECKTCHDPHGSIRQQSRTDLCLECHTGHPTMGWKSSAHALHGVACVDCHNPHTSTELPRYADIRHGGWQREKRLPMAVNDPETCYPCHQNIAAQFSLPSHHPLQQGKMRCTSCHDTHGGATGNLKEPTINLVCYKCHADKQGPFVYQHPPVEENCDICHNPHGTVANNLMRQPTTFLCLRCHSGHRGNSHSNIDQFQKGVAGGNLRPAFYTNCIQCHSQVHGSDVPSATRRGSRLQR